MNKLGFLVVWLGLGSTMVAAQSTDFKKMEDAQAFVEKLQIKMGQSASMKANFVQTKHLSALSEDIEIKGEVFYRQPSNLRWEYTEPIRYVMVMTKGVVYINDEGNVQKFKTSSNKVFKQINDMMVGSLNGALLANEDFDKEFFKNKQYYKTVLIPKNKDMRQYVSRMEILFDVKSLDVQEVRLIEETGDYTAIQLEGLSYNESIPDEKFMVR